MVLNYLNPAKILNLEDTRMLILCNLDQNLVRIGVANTVIPNRLKINKDSL